MDEWLADPKRPKVVHDPKLYSTADRFAAIRRATCKASAGIRHATMLYSYLLRPTTANHEFAEVVLRHLNRTLSGAPGERADFLLRLAPILRAEVENQGLLEIYEKIDLPLAAVWRGWKPPAFAWTSGAGPDLRKGAAKKSASSKKTSASIAGFEFNVNSPQQLAEVLFDG